LLLVDTYSRYPEVVCLNRNTTHDQVISAVKSIFARHGKPDVLYSDNGLQFVNNAVQRFLEEWEITQRTSSPRYPQSNGFIECSNDKENSEKKRYMNIQAKYVLNIT